MSPPGRENRPVASGPVGSISTPIKTRDSLTAPAASLADIDALAEHVRGWFVLQVTVDDTGHRRTYLYRSAAAAERAVARARERGRSAHVTLCQLLPVGVMVGELR